MRDLALVAMEVDPTRDCESCILLTSSSSPNAKAPQSWVDDITILSLASAAPARSQRVKSISDSQRSARGMACLFPSRKFLFIARYNHESGGMTHLSFYRAERQMAPSHLFAIRAILRNLQVSGAALDVR